MNIDMPLADRIRKCRKEQKMFIKTLAEKAGISANYINMIEHCRRNPSIEVLQSIARALNVSAEWLITGNGEKNVTEYVAPRDGSSSFPLPDGIAERTSEAKLKKLLPSDMQLMLLLLKWQRPDMFPQKICSIMDITEHELYMALDGRTIQCPKWNSACELLLLYMDAGQIQQVVKHMTENIMYAKVRNLSECMKKYYEMMMRYFERKNTEYGFTGESREGVPLQLEERILFQNDLIFSNAQGTQTCRFIDLQVEHTMTGEATKEVELSDEDCDVFKSYVEDWIAHNDGEILCFCNPSLFEIAYDIAHDMYVNRQNNPYATISIEDEGLQFLCFTDEGFSEAYPNTDDDIKNVTWK